MSEAYCSRGDKNGRIFDKYQRLGYLNTALEVVRILRLENCGLKINSYHNINLH